MIILDSFLTILLGPLWFFSLNWAWILLWDLWIDLLFYSGLVISCSYKRIRSVHMCIKLMTKAIQVISFLSIGILYFLLRMEIQNVFIVHIWINNSSKWFLPLLLRFVSKLILLQKVIFLWAGIVVLFIRVTTYYPSFWRFYNLNSHICIFHILDCYFGLFVFNVWHFYLLFFLDCS